MRSIPRYYLSIYYFYCLILAGGLTGCNDDIFLKPVPTVEDIVLDGHGGKTKFEVRKKELRGISIDCIGYDGYSQVFFYDKDGDGLLSPIDIDKVAKITYTLPFCAMDFLIDGNEVTAVALDNTLSFNIDFWVTLDYGATSTGFGITVTPGAPMTLRNMGYGATPLQTGEEKSKSSRKSLSNNSSLTQQLIVQPYESATSTVLLESSDNWETGVSGYVPVLYYNDGDWLWPPGPNAHIEIGNRSAYTPYGMDLDKTVTIDVPPYTKISVEVTVTYATCLTVYSCEMIMPGSGISNISWGTCQIRQPIDYKIEEVCEKL